jgi:four helix bundle protein
MEVRNQPAAKTRTRHYRDLIVWQKAMTLAKSVYRETERLPSKETYGLQSQMRRCAIGIPSNIAEGHGRLNDGHLRQFLAIARGSLYELQTQLELAGDLSLLEQKTVASLTEQSEEVGRLINGLLATLRPPTRRLADLLTC